MPPTHQSGPRRASLRPPPPRPPASWPACRPLIYAFPLDSRQDADAFNQPLSLDTSSVTSMQYMFQVRLPRLPMPPTHQSGPRRASLRPPPPRPPASWPACRPLIYAFPLDSRQEADAFNQPLTFDTSSVTSMRYMFEVRSCACPCHPLTSRGHAARHLGHRPHALPSPGPPAALSACPLLDSAVRASVQPAAEHRHVQRH